MLTFGFKFMAAGKMKIKFL